MKTSISTSRNLSDSSRIFQEHVQSFWKCNSFLTSCLMRVDFFNLPKLMLFYLDELGGIRMDENSEELNNSAPYSQEIGEDEPDDESKIVK